MTEKPFGEWVPFAVMSDVHANLSALRVSLTRLAAWEAGWGVKIPLYINGDSLDAGPQPLETLDCLESVGEIFVLGNHEDYLMDLVRHPAHARYRDPLWRFIPWTLERLGAERLVSFVRRCVFQFTSGDGFLNLVHASKESNRKMPAFFGDQGGPLKPLPQPKNFVCEKLYFVGHSHYSGLYWQPGTKCAWINSGSVGYPFFAKTMTAPQASFVVGRYRPVPDLNSAFFEVELHFEAVDYASHDLWEAYVRSGALMSCAPYSLAILAQSLFNVDLVYPIFQEARKRGVGQTALAAFLTNELQTRGVFERLTASCPLGSGFEITLEGARNRPAF